MIDQFLIDKRDAVSFFPFRFKNKVNIGLQVSIANKVKVKPNYDNANDEHNSKAIEGKIKMIVKKIYKYNSGPNPFLIQIVFLIKI